MGWNLERGSRPIVAGICGLTVLLGATSCGATVADGHDPPPPAATGVDVPVPDPMTISSPAFADGDALPVRYTCQGESIPPPLTWSSALGAAELALVVDDPDAPGGVFVHWIVTAIPAGPGATDAGQVPAGREQRNSAGLDGYFAPCPPVGSGVHHYRFTLYQLSVPLGLPPGAGPVQTAQAIAAAATVRVRMTGTFQR